MAVKIKPEVEKWIKGLSDEDMPGFASTVADVTAEIDGENTSAVDVARSVLKDPALTSRLLKLANSFRYNQSTQKIGTVSRAIMVLGFEKVRALTISLVLIDSLQAGQRRDQLTAEIAQSFHAAVQAQELARKTDCQSPENVFIAALLARLGNITFWAFGGDKADQVLTLIRDKQLTEEQAQLETLNFSLQELSQGLTRSWSLGELLEQTLVEGTSQDLSVNIVQLSHQLAEECSTGWESESVSNVIHTIANKLTLPENELTSLLHDNAKLAREITQLYGATDASNIIPQLKPDEDEQQQEAEQITPEKTDFSAYPEPNPQIQLTILQDMAAAFEEHANINIILEIVLEGLHRGVGMDSALFAILSKDHKQLICKYALGDNHHNITQQFQIDIAHKNAVFKDIIDDKKAQHVTAENQGFCQTTISLLGKPPYLVMPTIVKGKVIGLFIADRNASGRDITNNDFIAFQQFCQQANMGLTFLTMQG